MLDPMCIAAVEIQTDGVMTVSPAAPMEVAENGWRAMLVKVVNRAGVQSKLRVDSPNARPIPHGPQDDIENRWAAAEITASLRTERFRFATIATGDGGTVTFSKTRSTVDVTGAKSLLDAGESAGVLMPSGCRMGICFGCVAPLRQGAVRDLRSGDITTAAPGDGVVIQTCISAAAGACEIEL
jgi:ferredoxin